MQKKLQVFISSTFIDLQDERQAAVQAVLNAGHIPAGMELFKAGDKSQKETIKRWIEESDVYMLILGGRYGSIEEQSGKSYTQWEYDYAGELGKPRFAIVIKESYLDEKVRLLGKVVLERENPQLYEAFKADVLSKMSKFYSDIKDIKLTVLESLKEFERDSSLSGWISGKNISNQQEILLSNIKLMEENQMLTKEIEKLKGQINKDIEINGHSYQELYNYLNTEKVKLPSFAFDKEVAGEKFPLLYLISLYEDDLTIGITNEISMSNQHNFLFYTVAPKLISLGLMEKVKVTGKVYERIQTSKDGHKFLSKLKLDENNKNYTKN